MKKQIIAIGCMIGATAVLIAASSIIHARGGKTTASVTADEKVAEAEKEKAKGDGSISENLAGITVSLDKYSDKVNEEQVKDSMDELEADEETSDEEKALQLNLVYDRLGIAKVDTYLNVRSKPSRSAKIVGKMTKNAGCHIYKIKNGWAKIISNGVRGWVKASYLVKDEKAEKLALEVGKKMIEVTTETLNVRALPTTESKIYYMISEDEDYDVIRENLTESFMEKYIDKYANKKDVKEIGMDTIMSDLDNWACISIDDDKVFVSKEYVEFGYRLKKAVAIKEVRTTNADGSSTGISSTRANMVAYAMNFLGNRYVYGGTSLTNGTDCSGFTMRIYEHFGYSIPRTSSAQASASRTISSSEARPGDLFFYGSGSVSHVAMYIGNGQVIHASNEQTGIKISTAFYRTPIKVGRFIND